MKRAVSVSLGSSIRDKVVQVNFLGQEISIERIGTDGDMEAAALKYKELDGTVDAFGVGGADLAAIVDEQVFPFHSVTPMVRFVKKTPVVDGGGLKNTLENKAANFLDEKIGNYIKEHGRNVFVVLGVDRWGLSKSFVDANYDVIFGDLMFGLGLPIPIKSLKGLRAVAKITLPIVTRVPFEWIYPTGDKQDERIPKYEKYYEWATVIAGDCHYIKKHMPDNMEGKVIVTNTTTAADTDLFKKLGVKYLITITPVLDGRSFGTNMMEAVLVAISGKECPLSWDEYGELLDQLGFEPQIQELN